MGGRGRGRARGGAYPPSRVVGVVFEHLGVRGHVDVPPTVGELVWGAWSNFLAQPGLNLAALQPALPNAGGGGAVAAGQVAAGPVVAGGGRGVREAGRGRGAGGRGVSLSGPPARRTGGRGVGVEVGAGGRGRGMRGVVKVAGVYDECPICLLSFAETSGMIILSCGHRICRRCIQLWVNKGNGASGACPYCRQSLTNKDMDRFKDADHDKSGGGGGGGGFVGGSGGGRGGMVAIATA